MTRGLTMPWLVQELCGLVEEPNRFSLRFSSWSGREGGEPPQFAAVLQSAPDYAYSNQAQKAGNTKV